MNVAFDPWNPQRAGQSLRLCTYTSMGTTYRRCVVAHKITGTHRRTWTSNSSSSHNNHCCSGLTYIHPHSLSEPILSPLYFVYAPLVGLPRVSLLLIITNLRLPETFEGGHRVPLFLTFCLRSLPVYIFWIFAFLLQELARFKESGIKLFVCQLGFLFDDCKNSGVHPHEWSW
jgi:hypothetical protein